MKATLKNNESKSLKTRSIINWLQWLLILPVVLINSLLFKIFDWNGLEWLVMFLIYSLIVWFFRVRYFAKEIFKSQVLKISLTKNLLGFYFIRLSLNGNNILNYKTREKRFVLKAEQCSFQINFNVENNGKIFIYKVTERT